MIKYRYYGAYNSYQDQLEEAKIKIESSGIAMSSVVGKDLERESPDGPGVGDFGLVSKIENHDDVEEGDSRYMSLELLRGELDDLTKVRHCET